MLRGLLFDNLGLKLVALLLAVVVYLNVYTDRPTAMVVSFPVQVTDLPDSLTLSGPAPAAVQAELRGTGKQLIRLRVTEPPVRISLAGVAPGRFQRALGVTDLPLPKGVELQVDRMVSPRTLEFDVDRKQTRRIPVSPRFQGVPAAGWVWKGAVRLDPREVELTGPAGVLAELDSLPLETVSLQGKRDTLRTQAAPRELPAWCEADPPRVEITVPLVPAGAGATR
jgi:YbbR domain-containing protein